MNNGRCEHCGAAWTPAASLTKRQLEVWEWIKVFIEKHGHSPKYREIADGIGVTSSSSVHDYVVVLEQRGVLRRRREGGEQSLQVVRRPS